LLAQGEHLVHLLLVLGHDRGDIGVVPDIGELAGDGVLVDGNGHSAETLGGDLGPVEPRAVVADDRQAVAALEPQGGQAEREIAHMRLVLGPGIGLPDAAILLADGRPARALTGVALQQPR
jgi:hypothetical protein